MHARLTTFQMNDIDAAIAQIPDISKKLSAIPGLVRSQVGWNDDGSGVTMTVYESADAAEAAQSAITDIWGGLMPLLSGPPETRGFGSADVMK